MWARAGLHEKYEKIKECSKMDFSIPCKGHGRSWTLNMLYSCFQLIILHYQPFQARWRLQFCSLKKRTRSLWESLLYYLRLYPKYVSPSKLINIWRCTDNFLHVKLQKTTNSTDHYRVYLMPLTIQITKLGLVRMMIKNS